MEDHFFCNFFLLEFYLPYLQLILNLDQQILYHVLKLLQQILHFRIKKPYPGCIASAPVKSTADINAEYLNNYFEVDEILYTHFHLQPNMHRIRIYIRMHGNSANTPLFTSPNNPNSYFTSVSY